MLLSPVEIKYLTIGHQVAMQPELLYMNWVLSDPDDVPELYLQEITSVSHKLFKGKE